MSRSIDRDAVASLAAEGLSNREIARRLGHRHESVRLVRNKLGLPPHSQRVNIDVEKLIRLSDDGFTNREIARELGVSRNTARARCVELGLPQSYRKPEPKFDHEEIVRLSRGGMSAGDISKRLGCTKKTVERARKKAGLTAPHPGVELPPLEERLVDAERMLDEGAPYAHVQGALHLSQATLHRYLPGRGWSGLEAARWAAAHSLANKVYKKLGV